MPAAYLKCCRRFIYTTNGLYIEYLWIEYYNKIIIGELTRFYIPPIQLYI